MKTFLYIVVLAVGSYVVGCMADAVVLGAPTAANENQGLLLCVLVALPILILGIIFHPKSIDL